MKLNFLILTLIAIVFFTQTSLADEVIFKDNKANSKIKGTNFLRYVNQSALPNYIHFYNQAAPSFNQIEEWIKTNYKLNANYNWHLLNTSTDKLGYSHYRYQQTYKGINIVGSMYILHVKNGLVESMNGDLYNDLDNLNTSISFTNENALQIALKKINASVYKWQIAAEEKRLKAIQHNSTATYYPKGELNIVKTPSGYHLCYAFNIYAAEPLSRTIQYVNVNSGKIELTNNLIETIGTTGIAHTKFSGIRAIKTDSTAPTSFRLNDATRGLGIVTLNLQTSNIYANAVDFIDNDDNWNNINSAGDEAATDAHWGAEMTYDYYSIKHGRNSIDNAGLSLNSFVHYNTNYANAVWDGTEMTYGDGNVNNGFLIMTGLDVCGHEITHGLTSYTAQLGGGGTSEADALNEGFSDIFGTSIERFARPTQWDWLIGGDITCTTAGVPDGAGLRNMTNPALSGAGSVGGTRAQPICYLGSNWDPNGEPHNNNGPLIYWFYLLSTGDAGSNIAVLGVDTAGEIAYRTLTIHLTPNSTYSDTRFYSILSASELYGGCSTPTAATTNAWYKVCVGSAYVSSPTSCNFTADVANTCNTSLTVNFNNSSVSGNTFIWNFGDGTTSTAYSPSHTFSVGSYNVKLYSNGGTCGSDSITKTAYINVGPPAGPITMGATICGTSAVQLSATPIQTGDSIFWYSSAVGGSQLASGNYFTTPIISNTTTYYAEEQLSSTALHVGAANDNIGTNSVPNTNHYLTFDCTAPTNLQSVFVYSQATGNRTIELRDNNGTVLQSVNVNIPNGNTRIYLNFPIPIGTNFQLGFPNNTTNINLVRNNSGANYPYTNGPISITGNDINNGSYYYYFYDWIIKGEDCYTLRTPTVATANAGGTAPIASFNITDNGSGNISFNNTSTGGNTYQWNFGDSSAIDNSTSPTHQYSQYKNYTVTLIIKSASGCVDSFVQTINVLSSGIEGISPTLSVQGYPNPFGEQFNLQFSQNLYSGNIEVINALGQIVFKDVVKNISNYSIPTYRWANGNYILHLTNNELSWQMKLVKTNAE